MPLKLLMTSQSPSSSLHLLPTVIRVGCSHDNVTWTARVAVDVFSMDRDEVGLSYLPLSHIAAAMMDLYGMSRSARGGADSITDGWLTRASYPHQVPSLSALASALHNQMLSRAHCSSPCVR